MMPNTMISLSAALRSSVGKKVLMAITGLSMFIFVAEHMIGNLMLLSDNPDPYNQYAHFLINLGSLIVAAEIGLIIVFVAHVIIAVDLFFESRMARPSRYFKVRSAGGPSRKNISTATMIYTGILIGVFVVFHLFTFKYGPYYETTVDGVTMRDLYRLVVEVFGNPWYVAWYVAMMVLLGVHLRHGFWSAFQSLGVTHPRFKPFIYVVGIILAIVIAVGFLATPLYLYFGQGGA